MTRHGALRAPTEMDEKCVAQAFEIRAIFETVFAGHGPAPLGETR